MRNFIISTAFLLIMANAAAANLTISDAQCCFLKNPLGIEEPTFGWKLLSDRNGMRQSAWEIRISEAPNVPRGDVWDSGKVLGEEQFGIVPDGLMLKSASTYYWKARVWDSDGKASAWSEVSSFSTGILRKEDWKGSWITAEWESCASMPYFRKEFKIEGKVRRATVFACCLGAGDIFINGDYVDESAILDPAQTNYEQYALYRAIDVTGKLVKGENCVGAMIYDGWYNQKEVFANFSYGSPMLRIQLVIEYTDGASDVVATDGSWQWKPGPVVSANIYSGEVYDARLEVKDWCMATSCNIHGWKNASQLSPYIELRSQIMPPMRTKDVLEAVNFWKTSRGTWIYDFGKNTTSDIRIEAQMPTGTRFTVRMSEEKASSGDSLDFSSTGTFVVPIQTDEYIFKGEGIETWMPRGTYHGFRYAELKVSGSSITPQKEWLKAVNVHSDLGDKGHFECSDPQLNRLHELAVGTLRGSMLGVPVDCPTREKCGWLGDSHAYVKMQMMNFDAENFLLKYMDDIESGAKPELKNTLFHLRKNVFFYYADKASGIPFMIAPGKRLCGVASPDWGTAVVQLPWHLYLYCGNRRAIEKYYHFMKQWTNHVTSRAVGNIVYEGLGDWCPPYGFSGTDTPVELTSTAFHYYDLCIMEQAADLLGENEDKAIFKAEKEAVRKAFVEKFYNPVLKSFGSQTGNAMALDLGLCPEGKESEVAASIVQEIRLHDNFISTGIFGISRIGSALSRHGRADEAYALFTKKGQNSFEWMWDKYDATTLWENLPINDEAVSLSKNASHCHPMQAGYDSWFYEDVAGIRPASPGFKIILFQPCFPSKLKFAQASVESRYGIVRSEWHRVGNSIEWNISIPTGCSAEAVLPDGTIRHYESGDYIINLDDVK